ncbi:MAG: flagellar basal body P-ring formation chaperone FlgA [Pseudomonadota bacterium]
MNFERDSFRPSNRSGLRGFIAFIALSLWFLLAILSARPAAAAEASTTTATDLIAEIETALIERGAEPDIEIDLADPDQPVPSDARIAHAVYNPASGRFVIRLDRDMRAIAGIATREWTAPVLKSDLAAGEIVTEADIAYASMRGPLNRGVARDADDMIGKTARRLLVAGAPVRVTDLYAPVLVNKGAIVTLTYEVDGLRMTHQGVAMAKGADGDVISIKSIKSDRILKGVVRGPNSVMIAPVRLAQEG